jgi:hypothetical protein
MIIGPPPKFHEVRGILPSWVVPSLAAANQDWGAREMNARRSRTHTAATQMLKNIPRQR